MVTTTDGVKMDDVFAKMTEIIVGQLGVEPDQVVPTASFVDDLNADSLDLVELIMSLEEKFGVEIDDKEAENIRTVQEALDFLGQERDVTDETLPQILARVSATA